MDANRTVRDEKMSVCSNLPAASCTRRQAPRHAVRPPRRLASRICVALILAAFVVAQTATAVHAGDAADFDVDRALAYAWHLASEIGERTAGSDGEHRAAALIASVLVELGYEVEIQPFVFARRGEETLGMNVIAEKPGIPDYGTIYVGAHYDTAPYPGNGPGANDNASGSSTLLEVARVLASQEFTPTLKLIAFSAEEDGLVGSRYFARHLPATERMTAIGMLNMDCVGIGDLLHIDVCVAEHLEFAESLGIQADRFAVSGQCTDHRPFATLDIPALTFNTLYSDGHACGPDYHRPTDTPDKLEPAAIERTGTNLVVALRRASGQAQYHPLLQTFLPSVER